MSRFSGRAVTALSFAALLLGVAACGPGEEELPPIPTPTTPTPASPTTAAATPTTQAPTPEASPTVDTVRPEIDIPEPKKHPDMARDDIDGAESAARYFLDLYGYVYNTGDLRSWKRLVDPKCEECTLITERVEFQYEQGNWYEGVSLLHGVATRYYPSDDLPYYLVVVEVLGTESKHFDASGELAGEFAEVIYPEYMIGVEYRGPNDWKVMGASSGEGEIQ